MCGSFADCDISDMLNAFMDSVCDFFLVFKKKESALSAGVPFFEKDKVSVCMVGDFI